MELLSEEMQIDVVEKVLEELKRTGDCLNSWKAYWWESYLNCVLPQSYFDREHYMNEALDEEVSKIDDATETNEYSGVPLRHLVLGGKYRCDVCSIRWSRIETKHAIRSVTFNNNGNIECSKETKRKVTKEHPQKMDYEASYNVLSKDFKVNINIESRSKDYHKSKDCYEIEISLHADVLHIEYKDVKIDFNLKTGRKIIKINKGKDSSSNATVYAEAYLNPEGKLTKGTISIDTYKGNGKVNGSYRFTMSPEIGTKAMFYSRKGIRLDLTKNTALLYNTTRFLLEGENSSISSTGDLIARNCANSIEKAIYEELSRREIRIDMVDFNLENLKQMENDVIKLLKSIKGEIPVFGLVERIDECLERYYIVGDSELQKKFLLEKQGQ